MSYNSQYIMLLRTLVEEAADHRVSTTTDFAFLSGCIQGRLKQTLSVSTLERIWGYVDGYQSIRENTLNVLARFVGFASWRSFVNDYCEVPSAASSHRVLSPALLAADVPDGGRVRLCWNPGRDVVLLHLGDGCWRVESSVGSKLRVGDTFRCDRFILGHPVYLEELRQEGKEACYYVAGNKGGLTLAEVVQGCVAI